MQKINIRKIIYRVRHEYMTLNNVVIMIALLIAANWVWGALNMMQRNYGLQQEVSAKQRELQIVELQRDSLKLQQRYYQTDEYRELAARESLGLVMPGEKLLLIPDEEIEPVEETEAPSAQKTAVDTTGNMEQWLNFLFGGNSRGLEDSAN